MIFQILEHQFLAFVMVQIVVGGAWCLADFLQGQFFLERLAKNWENFKNEISELIFSDRDHILR